MSDTIIQLDSAELATVLAALRYWQRVGIRAVCPEADIAGVNGLWPEQIDALCERINTEGDTTGLLALVKRFRETIIYYAKISAKKGDDEGYRLKMLMVDYEIDPAIASAEGISTEKEDTTHA